MSADTALPWWKTGVIYQLYPRSFSDANGDGVGDLPGITARLDYLGETLGVDAVWLSPFFPSPMADFGYDVADYCDVDPLFGDLADFDELVANAHARGLKLIIDYVPNHSSDRHPWFVESRASRDSPKRDWYVWRDPAHDGGPPNNWVSVFGGPAWAWDEHTGQYYLHSFLEQQPDLNWRNPAVKEAMFDALRFWLDRGVDGFRIDVAHFIMKDPLERDNPLRTEPGPLAHKPLGDYDTQVHLYDKGHEDVHRIFREMRTIVDTYPDGRPRVTIGEIHEYDLPTWTSYYGAALDGLHMPFNFGLLKAEWSARSVRASVDALEAALPPGAWPNYVLGNHDETRIASRYGEAGSRLAVMMLLTLRGTPTLYYGDELAIPQADIPADRQQDPWGRRLPGIGRDGCRTPMAWSDEPSAGFTQGDEPWLPLHDDFRRRNVERQLESAASPLNLTRLLLALRKATPALQIGGYRALDQEAEECFVFLRTLDATSVLVALNFGDAERSVGLPGKGRVLLSTHLDRKRGEEVSSLTLRPEEGVVVGM